MIKDIVSNEEVKLFRNELKSGEKSGTYLFMEVTLIN